jgi:hypothetical protein
LATAAFFFFLLLPLLCFVSSSSCFACIVYGFASSILLLSSVGNAWLKISPTPSLSLSPEAASKDLSLPPSPLLNY